MRPQVIKQTDVGETAWIPVDYKQSPFSIGFGIVITGSPTFTVEHTFDDVFDSSITPTAFPHSVVVTKTANIDGNYAFPIRAVRLSITAGSGVTATMTILQGVR